MNTPRLSILGVAAATSLALAGCATPGYNSGYSGGGYGPGPSTANCMDCGTVTRIEQIAGSSVPQATGGVIGGLVGAAAGRELADDESEGRRNTATVAGAVAGAVAGNAIQNRVENTAYNVHVRMSDGRTVTVRQKDLDGLRVGSAVRVYNGRAWAQ